MSKVKIQGNASGTGVLTIEAPNTNTDRTITLPDTTGTLLDTNSSLSSSKLTGALPAIDGSNLTGIGGGKILQVVSATMGGGFGTGSTSYQATPITATITPSATNSKVFVMMTSSVRGDTQPGNTLVFTLYRNSTDISSGSPMGCWRHNDNSTTGSVGECSLSYLDSPNTTSATTYTIYMKLHSGSWVRMPDNTLTTGLPATITLFEVGV